MAFDPYLIWLDISPHERPVNYYRMFGLRPLEGDTAIIAAAAQRVIAHVSQFQNSQNAAACQQLLGDLNAARACLLDPLRKRAYDGGLTSPGGPERTLSGPPAPGGPAAVRPSAPSSTPAWMTSARAPRTQRAGERQIASTPPPPSAPAPSAAMSSSPTTPTISPRPQVPYVPAQQLQPPAKPASYDAPLTPMRPSGAMPFGAGPLAAPAVPGAPQGYAPPASIMPSPAAPYVPASHPPPPTATYVPPAATAYTQAPAYTQPQQPPSWAAAERTGQVGTVMAGDVTASANVTQPPPRRIFRRAQNNTTVYVVVALAIAMIVFFFGAVLLLALFMASG